MLLNNSEGILHQVTFFCRNCLLHGVTLITAEKKLQQTQAKNCRFRVKNRLDLTALFCSYYKNHF